MKTDRQIWFWAHMLDESYAEFSGVDFSRSLPWTPGETCAAKRLFYATDEVFFYGYALPDGTKLDFSRPMRGESGEIDHYSIVHAFSDERRADFKRRMKTAGNDAEDWNDLYEEVKYEATGAGLVRLYRSGSTYMLHMIQKPTAGQMDALYDMSDGAEDSDMEYFELYLPKRGLVQYESAEDFGRRMLNDVRNEF